MVVKVKGGIRGTDVNGHAFGIFSGQVANVHKKVIGCVIILSCGSKIRVSDSYDKVNAMLMAKG